MYAFMIYALLALQGAVVAVPQLVVPNIQFAGETSWSKPGLTAGYQFACQNVNVQNRVDCGIPGISMDDCVKKNCCFDSRQPSTIWCFYQNPFPVPAALPTPATGLISVVSAADMRSWIDAIQADIQAILRQPTYDDGSLAPLFLRLAWHTCATYAQGRYGSYGGGTMRYPPESTDPENKGLELARSVLDSIRVKYAPLLSSADVWTLAGVVAVQAMGGPVIPWSSGRPDLTLVQVTATPSLVPPNGLLPNANDPLDRIKGMFGRLGLSVPEMVALMGAHTVGRCHEDRSGFVGAWTRTPLLFSNSYYVQLIQGGPWNWVPPATFADTRSATQGQFQNGAGQMMLPSDIALLSDPECLALVQRYAVDGLSWKADFSAAFGKLLTLGSP